MKDAASIAERAANENWTTQRIAKAINRYAARLVKAERERCVKCAEAEATASMVGKRFVSAYQIIAAINTTAKKRPSKRKGRR
jgi:hypothetical protein